MELTYNELETMPGDVINIVSERGGGNLTKYFGIQKGNLPAITTLLVILATVFPKSFAYLAPFGEAMALMYVIWYLEVLLVFFFKAWLLCLSLVK